MPDYILQIVSPVVAAAVAWFFARRKTTAAAQANEIDNVEKALSIYRKMLQELNDQLAIQKILIANQSVEIQNLKLELEGLKRRKTKTVLK